MTKKQIAKEVVIWAASLFLALVCVRSGLMKLPGFTGEQSWIRDFQRWGYPDWFRLVVAAAELASCVLLLIPRTAGYGACIFALVMIGAITTHVTHGETGRLPFNFLLLALCVVVAIARCPRFINELLRKTQE